MKKLYEKNEVGFAAAVFGQVSPELAQLCSAGGIILLSGGYAWWLWKRE